MRLKPSLQVKVTVTGALYQPLLFGPRSGVAVMLGAVLSMFRLSVAVAWLPALSVAVPATA